MNPTTIFNLQQWIGQLDRLTRDNRCNSPGFLRPHHFVTLALAMRRAGKQTVTIPPALERYATRMHLWAALGTKSPVEVGEYEPFGRFVPLVRLENKNTISDTATQLAGIAKAYGADEETFGSLQISLMEIIGNCFAHNELGEGLRGLACAQSWPQGDLAQIAIADAGIGIRKSLSENPDLLAKLEAGNSCEIATEFGITSKPGKGHAGYGLALTRQLLAHAGGRLLVASGHEWFTTNGMNTAAGDLPVPWNGTIAVLEWSTRRPLRAGEVYKSWPLPEGFDDDDFDFEN